MPSTNITKVNIRTDTLDMVATIAAGRGVSTTQMLETMILFWLLKHAGGAGQ